jgi:holo-[acyl-carrier protein] synthase
MVSGIGIDIVKIAKMESAVKRWGESFLKRVFDAQELKKIPRGRMYYQRLAARFAAKEAVLKAISKEIPLSLKDILILNKSNGAPFCRFNKNVNLKVMLSISHIQEYAVASAVAQKRN